MSGREVLESLRARGVVIPCPEGVEVGPEVQPDRVAAGVVIHTGCRLAGAKTSIGPGSEIGAEGPATVEDCQLGASVSLKGGYFSGATFLDGVTMGSAAHVRPGTLLEEESGGAHAVGLKQTLFLPFVTAGSLVNFCDALMAGGTSRRDHSEIGSSYVHFNFTPNQDKATPSLVGDVPRGVMLDRPPIFLGGQGGMVGPVRIAYGTVIPAGKICRHDVLQEGRLHAPHAPAATRAFKPGAYRSIDRVVVNNLIFIGNLQAMQLWYLFVRKGTMAGDEFQLACYHGALEQLEAMLEERLRRLRELSEKMELSLELGQSDPDSPLPPEMAGQQQALLRGWPEIEAGLRAGPPPEIGARDRDSFLGVWERSGRGTYLEAIAELGPMAREAGTSWLQAVVDSAAAHWKAGVRQELR